MPSEAYQLVQLHNGSWGVYSVADAEMMHPGLGPAREAEALYVRQLRIPARAASVGQPFVIWDVGLGAAANAVAAIQACREISTEMHIVSFDFTVAPLLFALQHDDHLDYLRADAASVRELASEGKTQFTASALQVQWQLHLGDFCTLLRREGAASFPKPHAIFFDPFSPAKNPAMWSEELFGAIFRLLDETRPCALATYSRSTMIRAALLLAGFFVGSGQSSGQNEETTVAANVRNLIDEPLNHPWLQRAQRSGSAEPLQGEKYRQAPLTAETWRRLRDHPQFGKEEQA